MDPAQDLGLLGSGAPPMPGVGPAGEVIPPDGPPHFPMDPIMDPAQDLGLLGSGAPPMPGVGPAGEVIPPDGPPHFPMDPIMDPAQDLGLLRKVKTAPIRRSATQE